MINSKQIELSKALFDKLKIHYPEIELVSIVENQMYRDSIWINLITPKDENRDIEMSDLAAELSTDICSLSMMAATLAAMIMTMALLNFPWQSTC